MKLFAAAGSSTAICLAPQKLPAKDFTADCLTAAQAVFCGEMLWRSPLIISRRPFPERSTRQSWPLAIYLCCCPEIGPPKIKSQGDFFPLGILSSTLAVWPFTLIQKSTWKFAPSCILLFGYFFKQQHSLLQPLDIVTPQAWVFHVCFSFSEFSLPISSPYFILHVQPQCN